MSRNTSAIIKALVTNSLTDTLAGELRARKVIGVAVHAQATSYGPNITSNMRAERLITAMLSKIEFNPQRYHDFIEVLHLDGIKEDAEAALALLPNGMILCKPLSAKSFNILILVNWFPVIIIANNVGWKSL